MAGHNKPSLAMDPALVKYENMAKNRHKYFRWTPRTAWITIAYVVVVPTMFGYLGYNTDGKYEFRNKKRGDMISEW